MIFIKILLFLSETNKYTPVVGDRSPYPTVVILTKLHHTPSNQPAAKVLGNL